MKDIVITERTIDIKAIIKDRAPKTSRWIPGFIYSFIDRKMHVKEMNDFLFKNRHKMNYDFIDAAVEYLDLKLQVIGLDNVTKTGRYTIAANHPLGGPEGLSLFKIVGKVRKDITFLSNDILMSIPNLKQLFTPVNKHGSNADYVKLFKQSFEGDKVVIIFPAGLVSRKQKGEIRDFIWKSSYISRAIKYNRTIIPCHIDGKNSRFFYNLARFRTMLGIKINLEMFLLADEMLKHRGKTIKLTFGKAIPNELFDNRLNKHKWSAMVKDYVYKLKDEPELVFDNSYIEKHLKDY